MLWILALVVTLGCGEDPPSCRQSCCRICTGESHPCGARCIGPNEPCNLPEMGRSETSPTGVVLAAFNVEGGECACYPEDICGWPDRDWGPERESYDGPQ